MKTSPLLGTTALVSLTLGLLILLAGSLSSRAQGFIVLDNYNVQVNPLVTYGPGSGGTIGNGVSTAGWTVGLYFAAGDVRASVAADPAGVADPSTLGGGLVLGTGPGSTASLFISTFNEPGEFSTPTSFLASAAAGATVTIEIVAYKSASYTSSTLRGHSDAFTMTTAAGNAPVPKLVGDYMSPFSVQAVPEPSVFALSGLGAAVLTLSRRKK